MLGGSSKIEERRGTAAKKKREIRGWRARKHAQRDCTLEPGINRDDTKVNLGKKKNGELGEIFSLKSRQDVTHRATRRRFLGIGPTGGSRTRSKSAGGTLPGGKQGLNTNKWDFRHGCRKVGRARWQEKKGREGKRLKKVKVCAAKKRVTLDMRYV